MPKKTCMESALDCLSRRAFAIKELAGKLKNKGYPGREIFETINRMEEMGYLNDIDFAIVRIRGNINRWGKKRIEQDLYTRGVSRDTAEDAFFQYLEKENIESYNWKEKALNTLLQRFKKWQEPQISANSENFAEDRKQIEKEKNRRLRFLIGRGYSIDEAMYAMENSKSIVISK